MQSDVVAIAVSTGIGVSVIAGFLSGVCYVLAHGFTRKRTREPTLQWWCAVCGGYLREEKIKIVLCTKCEERVCRKRCSKRDNARKKWICHNCLNRPTFFQSIFNSFRLPLKEPGPGAITKRSKHHKGKKMENNEFSSNDEKECIRDFIEKLISTIMGESVDDASVFRMYNDKHYIAVFDKYHPDLRHAITNLSSALQISMKNASFSEQNPSSAHTNLKQLIERILRDVAHLPRFREETNNSTPDKQTYEDLLATAILNKIIDKKTDLNWSSKDGKIDQVDPVRDEIREAKWREVESTSTSSLEEYLQSDSSYGSSKYVDRVSLTIKQRIDEIPNELDDVDQGLDDFDYDTAPSSLSNQSNWYLQRRQFQGKNSPIPVPMLVPNPLTSAKVLIGDQEIDDTSDLSDAESDRENSGVQNLIIDSSLVIEEEIMPKNDLSDEETSFDSGVREDRDDFNDGEKFFYPGPKNNLSVDDDNVEDASLHSSMSNTEKDAEYSEKYSTLPRTIYKSVTTINPQMDSYIQQQKADISYQPVGVEQHFSEPEENENDPLIFQGRYSRREKEKWKNAVSMSHNPYSEENIKKRIQHNERYGRDYYTKQASIPSGRIKTDEDHESWAFDESKLYRAEPTIISDSEFSSQNQENYQETSAEWNVEEQDDLSGLSSADLSFIQRYSVENSKIYYDKPHKTDEKKFEIKVNEKEVFYPDSEELTSTSKDTAYYIQSTASVDDDLTKSVEITRPLFVEKRTDFNGNVSPLLEAKPWIKPSDEVSPLLEVKPWIKPSDEISPKEPSAPVIDAPASKISSTHIQLSPRKSSRENLISDEFFYKETPSNNLPSPLGIVSKKSDNTWIKKIYSNPIVRNFALSNREHIPPVIDDHLNKSKPKELKNEPSTIKPPLKDYSDVVDTPKNVSSDERKHITPDNVENKEESKGQVSGSYHFSLEFSDNGSIGEQQQRSNGSLQENDDVIELKERRLVANRLGEFSKSFPNLSRAGLHKQERNFVVRNESTVESRDPSENSKPYEHFVSVKDLKKLFENNDQSRNFKKDKPVHSLTARTISRDVKERLSSYNN